MTIKYQSLVDAISNAALSRKAALQVELAVGLIHFAQENEGTDTQGKANLKAIYHGAGYECLAKADRDYKTVNRRLNATAKLFDKLGSSLVNTWVENKGATESVIEYVVTELEPYALYTIDDVLDYCGAASNRTRAPRQPVAAPVTVTAAGKETDAETDAETEAVTVEQYTSSLRAELLAKLNDAEIREFVTSLLVAVVERESAGVEEVEELKAA